MNTIETLADLKREGITLLGHCRAPNCGKARPLDLDALIVHFGPDYVFINEARIARAFKCEVVGHHGAGGQITISPNTRPNSYAAASGR